MSNSLSKGLQTRRERLEEREEAIIAAAHDVFVEHGFVGTKMVEIAARTGVAEGTVYLYFKNKNALLLAVVGKFYKQLTKGAAEGIQDIRDTHKRLEFLARHHLVSCLSEWRILELVVGLYRHMPEYESEGHYKFNKAYVAVFNSVVREAVNRGEVRKDIPLWIIRDLFYGSLEYSARTHLLRSGGSDDIELIVKNVMQVLRRGIGLNENGTNKSQELSSVVERLDDIASRLENTV